MFAVRSDGTGVDVTVTYGPTSSPPELSTKQPEDLTSMFVTSIVVRLVDEGL